MNKTRVPAFCIMFLMMAAIVWAVPVPHTGQMSGIVFQLQDSALGEYQ